MQGIDVFSFGLFTFSKDDENMFTWWFDKNRNYWTIKTFQKQRFSQHIRFLTNTLDVKLGNSI